MLGQDQGNKTDEFWEELKQRARTLVDKLENGDFTGATEAIDGLNESRDQTFYREVGKLTRGLHDAIVNFEIETPPGEGEENSSKMANAQDRLDYVIKLTQTSADKTMDMVEEGIPLASEMGEKAVALRDQWHRLARRELGPDQFRELYRLIDQYLAFSCDGSGQLNEKLNTILMAQDFQDLTGQVIKRVISLVQDVEVRLVELMRVAGQVEELTGIIRNRQVQESDNNAARDSVPEGPQIHAEERTDVVSGQDEVDDLLSSLGF